MSVSYDAGDSNGRLATKKGKFGFVRGRVVEEEKRFVQGRKRAATGATFVG